MSPSTHPGESSSFPPDSLFAANPLRWLAIFGPGAVIASLTIGVGELVFSARAGALFGYRLLWFFGLVLILKWALVFASARHIVLTGAHPFQRLDGPPVPPTRIADALVAPGPQRGQRSAIHNPRFESLSR